MRVPSSRGLSVPPVGHGKCAVRRLPPARSRATGRWAAADVVPARNGIKRFRSPEVGWLNLHFETMDLTSGPGVVVRVHQPAGFPPIFPPETSRDRGTARMVEAGQPPGGDHVPADLPPDRRRCARRRVPAVRNLVRRLPRHRALQ
ncbi:hypothetical protein [Corynebacterium halotolerans]|uniref:MmyB family transcriptional regulator n=1 Tax=Corynebacterium halotolerans TaxID=225326 RepID=UPI0013758FFD